MPAQERDRTIDLILRAQARYLAGGKRRTLAPDCFEMFFEYFGRH
jgi:hypothetical protein